MREELLERAKALGLPYAEEVADFCSAVIGAFEPWCIIVHGSVARGDYVLGRSDVDVLVISDRFEGMDVRDRLSELLPHGAGRRSSSRPWASHGRRPCACSKT